jgi:hypothetical protein
MESKINFLLAQLPRDAVITPSWLRERGIDRNLTARYLRSGWLVAVGTGAYMRTGGSLDWPGVMWGLQQAGSPVWGGGQTALELTGHGQNVPLGSAPVFLFGEPGTKLPAWARKRHGHRPLTLQTPSLFNQAPPDSVSFQTVTVGELALKISTLERAVIELAYGVRDEAGFEQLDHAVQAMMALRPVAIQALLEACTLVRVVRLVLLLADHYQLPWLKRLDSTKMDLGSGKRQLWPGSAIHPKYHISVPKGFLNALA